MFLPQADDGITAAIPVPNMPFGNSIQTSAYVSTVKPHLTITSVRRSPSIYRLLSRVLVIYTAHCLLMNENLYKKATSIYNRHLVLSRGCPLYRVPLYSQTATRGDRPKSL